MPRRGPPVRRFAAGVSAASELGRRSTVGGAVVVVVVACRLSGDVGVTCLVEKLLIMVGGVGAKLN